MKSGRSRHTILLVDDEETTRHLLALRIRQEFDIELLHASSAEEGKGVLSEVDVDLVICDYNMDRDNGFDLLDVVENQHPSTPFILFSGHTTLKTTHIQHAKFYFIHKPNVDAVMSKIRALLRL